MQLGPAQGGRVLRVASGFEEPSEARSIAGPGFVCRLGPGRDRRTEAIRMERVASALASSSLARKGILLHGALASRDGAGFILAGPSGAGKTTASRRLPSPWQSLSDDCALVVRDTRGRYWAHPWPTWSRLRGLAPAESWPVEQAVPLKAMLFLRQSPVDHAEPVTTTPATALIMESAFQLGRAVVLTPDGHTNRAVCRKYLRAAWALAAAIPAFRLRISMTGQFWREIERVLSSDTARAHRIAVPADSIPGLSHSSPRQRRRSYVCPRPPRSLLSGSLNPRLVCFKTRSRTFLKLLAGKRVLASANDLLREWHVERSPGRL
jgi:SynChlorMet cassette protein ScmC